MLPIKKNAHLVKNVFMKPNTYMLCGLTDKKNQINGISNALLLVEILKIPLIWILHMSFDRFLLAVESLDLSQAEKSIIRVSFFPNEGNEW